MLTTTSTALDYGKQTGPAIIDPGLTVTDKGSANLAWATVAITGGYDIGQDVLAFTNSGGIAGSWNASTGTLTLSGSASLGAYESALRSVTYVNTSDNPSTAQRTVSFEVNDGATGSNTATRTIQVHGMILPDLNATFGQSTLPQMSVPGDKGVVPVIIKNDGDGPAVGSITVELTAWTQDALDGHAAPIPLAKVENYKINLGTGKSTTLNVPVTVTAALPPDSYYVQAAIDTTGAIPESDEGNNTVLTDGPRQVVWQFGNVGGRTNVPISYADADGTLVTLSLSGPGVAEVARDGDGWDLRFTQTNTSSVATITTKKSSAAGDDGEIRLNGVTVGDSSVPADSTSLKSLVAKTANLTGLLEVTGGLTTLTLADVTGGMIRIGSAPLAGSAAVTIAMADVSDASIDSATPIKALTAIRWLDQDGSPDSFSAPSLAKLTITGQKANLKAGLPALSGDFQADLNLGSASGTAQALGTMSVAGALDSSTITAGGHDGMGISIGTIKAGRVGNATVMADDGGVNSLSTSQWQAGSITAGWIGTISTKANATLGGLGHFGANLTLTGSALPAKKATLGSVQIAGDLLSGTEWDVQAGTVGSLAFTGTVDHSIIRSAGDVASIKLGASNGSDFGAGVSCDLMEAQNHALPGDSVTGTVKSFTVTGLKVLPGQLIPRFFVDSCVSSRIGTMSLLNWDGLGGLFAPTGGIKSVKHKDTADNLNSWIWPAPPQQVSSGPEEFIHLV